MDWWKPCFGDDQSDKTPGNNLRLIMTEFDTFHGSTSAHEKPRADVGATILFKVPIALRFQKVGAALNCTFPSGVVIKSKAEYATVRKGAIQEANCRRRCLEA